MTTAFAGCACTEPVIFDSVAVSVIDRVTRQPVSGAVVRLSRTEPHTDRTLDEQQNGRYVSTGAAGTGPLEGGRFELTVSRDGYATHSEFVMVRDGAGGCDPGESFAVELEPEGP